MRGRGRVAEAAVLLVFGGSAQRWVPMRWWSGTLGEAQAIPSGWTGLPHGLEVAGEARSRTEWEVARAVRRASERVPWSPTCLAQVIAAQVMLRQRGAAAVAVIGLRRAEDGAAWDAHAWLIGSGLTVTGGPAARGFTPTTVFAVRGGLAPDDLCLSAEEPPGGQPA
jgi:hypothetical protein